MATIKYDVSDVPEGGGGVQAPPNMYAAKIASVKHRDKKNDGSPADDLEVIVDVGPDYARIWSYIQMSNENTRWKVREFLDAVGFPPKGELTDAKLKKLAGTPVMAKVTGDNGNNDTEDPDYRARIKNLYKPGETAAAATSGDEEIEGADYDSWSDDDLKDEIKERGLTLAGRFSKAKAITLLQEDDATEEDGAEASEDAANLPEGYEDIDEWSDDDLKEELKEKDIKLTGRFSTAKAVEAILEAAGAAEPEEEPTGDEPEPDNYDDEEAWPTDDLKAEIEERVEQGATIELPPGRKTRQKLIDALRADDASEPF